jgi:hypothetical protein
MAGKLIRPDMCKEGGWEGWQSFDQTFAKGGVGGLQALDQTTTKGAGWEGYIHRPNFGKGGAEGYLRPTLSGGKNTHTESGDEDRTRKFNSPALPAAVPMPRSHCKPSLQCGRRFGM